MKYLWLNEKFSYDGTQLKSLFTYMNFKLLGDSILSWIGPCNVSTEHMVDGEDLLAKAEIRSDLMLHFIVEKFGCELFAGVCLQRLLSALAHETLLEVSTEAQGLTRAGDDLWLGDRKLSISIATSSPVSCLIHFALNITNEGTPVKTLSLKDLEVDPVKFSSELGQRFIKELEEIGQARCKVKWVP